MKHASQSDFGRPVEFVLSPDQNQCIDKWQALNALTDAAQAYELSHRTLGVLKALMSFLPGRMIHPMPGEAIVFPSNRTLSHRLNGMPDSTLRRHLARLVDLGIVSRHDSPNRKRYARSSGQASIAFGFDLSPLARHAGQLQLAAEDARNARAHLQTLRARLASLHHRLLEVEGDTALADNARRVLRRKPNQEDLEHFITQINARLTPEKTSAPDAQNERHIQARSKYNSDSEALHTTKAPPKKTNPSVESEDCKETHRPISLGFVLERCTAFQSFFPDQVYNWADLVRTADRLAMMLGIDAPVFQEAGRVLGLERASIVVLCMLEQVDTIRNPGGYLRRITQRARLGRVDVLPMLKSPKLSADNSNNDAKSMC